MEKDYKKLYGDALEWMKEIYPTLKGSMKEDAEHYWSSKCVNNYNAWCMYFYDKFQSMCCDGRYYGESVRLVK
jgi:hypothetical protein